MSYRVTRKIDPKYREASFDAQDRHTRLVAFVEQTLTAREAAERYRVGAPTIVMRVPMAHSDEFRIRDRYFITDIEAVFHKVPEEVHKARPKQPMEDLNFPLWFVPQEV